MPAAARHLLGLVSRLAVAGAIIWALSAAVPVAAWADPSGAGEITFQEGLVADGGALADQYQSSVGVEFGAPTPDGDTLGFPGTLPSGTCQAQPTLLTNGYFAPGASPVVQFASRSGGTSGCSSGEFYGARQGFLFHLDDARASLSMMVRAFATQSNETSDVTGAEVIAYDAAGDVVDDVSLNGSQATTWSSVALSTADPTGIQFVAVIGEIDIGAAVGVQIDDVQLPAALAGTLPEFRLAPSTQSQSGDLVEGDTLSVPVQIVRENGSSGTVTVSASDGGSSALSGLTVDQKPAGEPPDTALVQLTARPGQAGASVTVTVSGSGDAGSGALSGPPLTMTFAVQRDLTLTGQSATVAPLCHASAGLVLHVAGQTAMNVVVAGPAYSQTVAVTGPGDYPVDNELVPNYLSGSIVHLDYAAAQSLPLGQPPQFATSSTTVTFSQPTPAGTVSSGSSYTTALEAGLYPEASTTVTARLSGLPCEPQALAVGADGAESSFTPDATGGGTVTVPVPPAATAPADGSPAPMSILSPEGTTLLTLPPVYLDDFRAADAPHFTNFVDGNVQWSDMENTFGPSVEDCAVVCWHNPQADSLYQFVQGLQPFGLCFGYAMFATELLDGGASPLDFGVPATGRLPVPQAGATAAGAPLIDDSTSLGQTLVSLWLDQLDTAYYTAGDGTGGYGSVAAFVSAVQAALTANGAALVSVRLPNGVGHTVVAYGLSLSAGTYTVDVYNPNLPYGAAEAASSSTHTSQLASSQITLNAANPRAAWTVTGGLSVPKNSGLSAPVGSNWTGTMARIGLTTLPGRPLHPSLTPGNVFDQLFQMSPAGASPGGPAVAITQITAAGKDQLNGLGVPTDGSSIKVVTPPDSGPADVAGVYELPHGHPYTVHTRARHSGRFGLMTLGHGGGAGILDAPSGSDAVTFDPSTPTVSMAAQQGGPVTVELLQGADGPSQRVATVRLDSAGPHVAASLTPAGALAITHAGAATKVTVQLFSDGVAVGSPSVTLPGGKTLTIAPVWHHLTRSVSVTVGRHRGRLRLTHGRAGSLGHLLGIQRRKHHRHA
jgi:hypothetical protein